ncbi:MAG: hypothetical protein V9F03_05825 [Microthrixaceae bacterium]
MADTRAVSDLEMDLPKAFVSRLGLKRYSVRNVDLDLQTLIVVA